MPTRFDPPQAETEPGKAFSQLADILDERAPLAQYPVRHDARLGVAAGAFVRVNPRAGGQEIVIPRASSENFGQTITILKLGGLAPLRIQPVSGAVNGNSFMTVPAATKIAIVLYSDGDGNWLDTSYRGGGTLQFRGTDVRLIATVDVELTADADVTIASTDDTVVTADDISLTAADQLTLAGADVTATASDDMALSAGDALAVTTGGAFTHNASTVLTQANGATTLRGPGLTVSGTTLKQRLRPRLVHVQDYFLDRNTTGTIGQIGWSLLGSATVSRAANVNFTQTTRFALVSPTAGNGGLALGPGTNGILNNANVQLVQAGMAIPSAPPANWHVGFGISDDQDAPFSGLADGVGFYATNATANWQAIIRSGSAGSPTDTGVAVSSVIGLFTIVRNGGNYEFYIANTLVATIAGSFSGNAAPCFVCGTTTAASTVTFPIGYFGMNFEPGGYLDDDDFLEI